MSQLLNRFATVAAAALFPVMAISGVLMFLEIGGPLKEAHEILGLVFVAAVGAHLLRNWTAFAKLFSYPRTYVALGLVVLATLALSLEEMGEGGAEGGGNPMRRFIDRAAVAPISTLAPVVGETPEALVARMIASGLKVDSTAQSLADLAKSNNLEMPRLLSLVSTTGESVSMDEEDEN
jgi:hypothetical protein